MGISEESLLLAALRSSTAARFQDVVHRGGALLSRLQNGGKMKVAFGIAGTAAVIAAVGTAAAIQVSHPSTTETPDRTSVAFIAVPGPSVNLTPASGLAPVSVADKRDIRCYYRADLSSEYQIEGSAETPRRPYMGTGIEEVGFNAKTNLTPEDPSSGLLQVANPINQCSRVWDLGGMIMEGINDDLVPDDLVSPPLGGPAERTLTEPARDQNGNLLYADPNIRTFGNYIPILTECVIDGKVSVIPGTAEVCNELGIPSLAK
ncbi:MULTISPECIES: hypothetical protein [unclassified Pseudarthrobacter]|uniref:hypothetical protein n=1 Tax=unclassified Pseudarthrobacter TaxID=2647000 RepID=UPI003634EE23